MIDLKSIESKKEESLKYLSHTFDQSLLKLDHVGIMATEEDYQNLKKEIGEKGKIYHEFFRKGNRWYTSKMAGLTYEVFGLFAGKFIPETHLDHVAFVVDNLEEISKKLEEETILRFDVKNTHGIKIQPQKELIIEIRNNNIIDSIPDFLD